jgi:hypothetical protein
MPCNASYARFIFGKFFTSTIILYVLLFAQKVLFFFLQKVGVTEGKAYRINIIKKHLPRLPASYCSNSSSLRS